MKKKRKHFVFKAGYQPQCYFETMYGGKVLVGRAPHPVVPIWETFILAGHRTGDPYLLLVSAHRKREDSEEAMKQLERAIRRYGRHPEAVLKRFWEEVEAIRTSGDQLPEDFPGGVDGSTRPFWLRD
jgi:hypothetical protein